MLSSPHALVLLSFLLILPSDFICVFAELLARLGWLVALARSQLGIVLIARIAAFVLLVTRSLVLVGMLGLPAFLFLVLRLECLHPIPQKAVLMVKLKFKVIDFIS